MANRLSWLLLNRHTATQELSDQCQLASRLCRTLAVKEARAERAETASMRDRLAVVPMVPHVDAKACCLNSGGQLVPLPSSATTHAVAYNDPCITHALVRSQQLVSQKSNLTQSLVHAWDKHHFPSAAEDLPEVPPLPAAMQLTTCFIYGYNNCVCRGYGLLLYLAKKKFCDRIAKSSPKKSMMRRLLQAGFLVVEIGGIFLHIAMMYLRPRRATFIQAAQSYYYSVTPLTHFMFKPTFSQVRTHTLSYKASI